MYRVSRNCVCVCVPYFGNTSKHARYETRFYYSVLSERERERRRGEEIFSNHINSMSAQMYYEDNLYSPFDFN